MLNYAHDPFSNSLHHPLQSLSLPESSLLSLVSLRERFGAQIQEFFSQSGLKVLQCLPAYLNPLTPPWGLAPNLIAREDSRKGFKAVAGPARLPSIPFNPWLLPQQLLA